ncbi:MAG: hypothetical protein M2R45_04939 [Verrucomicrobia subdivision 3 bacterium]|nr:hypothetical protein [Limisphaerales bacterium]
MLTQCTAFIVYCQREERDRSTPLFANDHVVMKSIACPFDRAEGTHITAVSNDLIVTAASDSINTFPNASR